MCSFGRWAAPLSPGVPVHREPDSNTTNGVPIEGHGRGSAFPVFAGPTTFGTAWICKAPSMSLLNNFIHQIYRSDLPVVLFMVRDFYRSNLLQFFLVKVYFSAGYTKTYLLLSKILPFRRKTITKNGNWVGPKVFMLGPFDQFTSQIGTILWF